MNRRRTAVTLTELAASVAALGMAAALLAPALGEVRRYGKDTMCLQNLAQIAQASILYASIDPEEQAVPLHPIAGYGPAHGTSSSTLTAVLAVCYGGKSGAGKWGHSRAFWGTAYGRGPASRPLNGILYKGGLPDYAGPPYGSYGGYDVRERWAADTTLDLSIYRCPSDSGYTGIHYDDFKTDGLSSYDFFGNSYHANTMWIGYGPGSRLSSNSPFWHRLSEVVNPAETLYYQEHCSRFAHFAAPLPANCDPGPYEEVVKGWHGQDWEFNVAFVDGHADQVRIRGFENPKIGRYPGFTDPNYGHNHYRCVINRGPGWQLDTLPVPPVPTGLVWKAAGDEAERSDCNDCPLRIFPPPGRLE